VPDSAGGFEVTGRRSHLVSHTPTGDLPTTWLRKIQPGRTRDKHSAFSRTS
jgi:hypothetical protein